VEQDTILPFLVVLRLRSGNDADTQACVIPGL
jgi:hypothetical protein